MEGKKTPLYDVHVQAGGRIVEFGGWLLPVQYKAGIIAEHKAVRTAAGLFDVSHMGEIWAEGSEALAFLQQLLTNDFTDLKIGQTRYSPMCYLDGGTVDDLLVYKFGEGALPLGSQCCQHRKRLGLDAKDGEGFQGHPDQQIRRNCATGSARS
jgi:glycine cleavage system aminomethyltransferase T